jgi:hypothetical protein
MYTNQGLFENMALEKKADALHVPNWLCFFCSLFAFFLQLVFCAERCHYRLLWQIITSEHQDCYYSPRTVRNKPDTNNILSRKTGPYRHDLCEEAENSRQLNKPPLPSILLANVQSLENKIDDLRARLNYQRDIENCNILFFPESWRQDRTAAASGKTRGGGLCIFVNNSWCTICKEVSSFCSADVSHDKL